MVKKQLSSSDRLALVREKLKNTDLGGGGGGFISLKDGSNTVRILPEVGKMEVFYQTVGYHVLPGSDKRIYCPDFTTQGEKQCPICELVKKLYRGGGEANKKLAGEIRVQKKYWMNVINRKDETPTPLILTAGPQIFNPIAAAVGDEDYGDIYDPEHGIDIVIKRSGEGMQTKYEVLFKRNASQVIEDLDGLDDLLDQAKDLSPVEVSMDPEEDGDLSEGHAVWLMPYERIEEEANLKNVDELMSAAQDDGDEYEPPAKSSKRPAEPAPKSTTRRQIVDDDEGDGGEEAPARTPARSELSKRLEARRSARR